MAAKNPITAIFDGFITGATIMISIPFLPIFITGKALSYAAGKVTDKALNSSIFQDNSLLNQSKAEKQQRDLEREQRNMERKIWEEQRTNAIMQRRIEVQEKRRRLINRKEYQLK